MPTALLAFGFSSLSGFYHFFKEKTGLTPVKYRKMNNQSVKMNK